MLTEKEEIQRIRKSIKAGMSKDLIAKKLMNKGYKYDYVSLLMKKAEHSKKILFISLTTFIFLGLLTWAIYGNFFTTKNIQVDLVNPLEGITVYNSADIESNDAENPSPNNNSPSAKEASSIEVTVEFIDYLLGTIQAQNYLHKIPLTDNVPIINFKTEDKKFFSTIDEGIQTNTGTSSEADLEFYIPNEIVILTTASSDPKSYFIKEVESGNVKIETLAGEAELFSKGYLNFYGSLTSN